MRRGVGTVAVGAILLIAAVAGFVVVPEHQPAFKSSANCAYLLNTPPSCHVGWSRTAYDVARIATWAILIAGALLVVLGLIRYARPGVTAS